MTSKQVMLILAATALVGCDLGSHREALVSPYVTGRVWAVVPLMNESGTAHADGYAMADRLVNQIQLVAHIDALPVNRTLAAMEALEMDQVSSPAQVMALMGAMGVDGLIVGTITAYDPYDPPKLGLTLELYTQSGTERYELDLRRLTTEGAENVQGARGSDDGQDASKATAANSGYWDAADPAVRQALMKYAKERGAEKLGDESWRRYRSNMNLYSEFVVRQALERILRAEIERLYPLPANLETSSP